jgi:hypothetical protein
MSRELFIGTLNAEGIPVSCGYNTPIYKQPFMLEKRFGPFSGWKNTNLELDYSRVMCPVVEKAAEKEACWLSQSVLLGDRKDMDDIITAISKIYEKAEKLNKVEIPSC